MSSLVGHHYLKKVGALRRDVKQKDVFPVTVHKVGTVLREFVVVKMLVTRNVGDFHVWAHKWMVAVVRRQANETVKLFQFTRVPCILEEDIMKSLLSASEDNRMKNIIPL